MPLLISQRLSESAHRNLIEKLLKTAPDLLEKIAPDGFENSIYVHLYRIPVEVDYRSYRKIRENSHLWKKKNNKGKRICFFLPFRWKKKPIKFEKILTFDEFSKQVPPWPPVSRDEPAMILMHELYMLASEGSYFYNDENKLLSFDDFGTFCKQVNIVAAVKGLSAELVLLMEHYRQYTYKDNPIILSEVHRHIFEFFKKEGLEWFFRENHGDFFESLRDKKVVNDSVGEEGIKEIYEMTVNYLDRNKPNSDFEQSVSRFLGDEPLAKIETYKEVYGDWPQGSPPKMTEYI